MGYAYLHRTELRNLAGNNVLTLDVLWQRYISAFNQFTRMFDFGSPHASRGLYFVPYKLAAINLAVVSVI